MSAYRRTAQRVFWGPEALGHLASELARGGASRPLLVCGSSVRRHPRLIPRVIDAAGGSVAGVFAGVGSYTPLASVEAASAALDETGADSLVAVGGGSALVTARAAAILHGERRPVPELATRVEADGSVVSPRLLRPKLPILAVPTTPTTAVCKAGTAVTPPGNGGRLAMFDPGTRSRAILLDPEHLASSPGSLVRNAALNAIVMAVEGLATGRSHVFSDALLVHGVRRFAALLPALAEADPGPEHRMEAALASILVGDGTDTTGGGLTAALSHTIGHHHRAHNGTIDAILLPHVLDAVPPAPSAWDRIAEGLGCAPASTADRLRELLATAGAPGRLRDVGVQPGDVDGLAAEASGDFSYRRVADQIQPAAVVEVLRQAW